MPIRLKNDRNQDGDDSSDDEPKAKNEQTFM